MLREDLYAIVKTLASLAFFNFFKIFGDFLKLQENWVLFVAVIALYFYFLAIDLHLQIQDDFGFCDGIIKSMYGVLISQIYIPNWMIHLIFSGLILVKNLKSGTVGIPISASFDAPTAPFTTVSQIVVQPCAAERSASAVVLFAPPERVETVETIHAVEEESKWAYCVCLVLFMGLLLVKK